MTASIIPFPPIGEDHPILYQVSRITDIELARRAAAEVSKHQGYPQLEGMYLRGDNDADADVQSALVAIKIIRRIESVQA